MLESKLYLELIAFHLLEIPQNARLQLLSHSFGLRITLKFFRCFDIFIFYFFRVC